MTAATPPPTGGFDWQVVHQRLARARQATEDQLRLSPEQAQAVMEERARLLAQVPPQAPDAAEVLEAATFRLARERYALETRHIREVVSLTDLVPIPGAPAHLAGLLNLRGEILAVVDLHQLFDIAEEASADAPRVIVLGGERAEFGIKTNAVDEVKVLRHAEVLEPPAGVAGVCREYLRGVTRDGLIVLDGDALLQTARLFIDQDEEVSG